MKKLLLTYQTLDLGTDDKLQRWILEASNAANQVGRRGKAAAGTHPVHRPLLHAW